MCGVRVNVGAASIGINLEFAWFSVNSLSCYTMIGHGTFYEIMTLVDLHVCL